MSATQIRATDLAAGYDPHAMAMTEDALIREATRRLSEAAPGAEVILFGSRARGEGGETSDLDILVIEPKLPSPRAEFVRLRAALRGLGVPIDLVVVSADDAERWRDMRGTMVNEAFREGRVLVSA
jgi:predicted nucleotidyltransferase